MLAGTRTVIVDEIHAIAGSKRGSHLALTRSACRRCAPSPDPHRPVRHAKPIERVARFWSARAPCAIVDIGHARQRDLDIEVPPVPLSAVMANDVWELVYDRLAALAREHRTTLIFVNTRRLAERLTAT
jgi:ATP-dependent Lhr-like helicase